jgi:hypothetical protein
MAIVVLLPSGLSALFEQRTTGNGEAPDA